MPKFWTFLPEAMYLPNIIHWFFLNVFPLDWKWQKYTNWVCIFLVIENDLVTFHFSLWANSARNVYLLLSFCWNFFFVRILLKIQFLVEIIYSDCVWSLLLRTFFVILVLLIWSRGRHPCMFKVILDSKIKEALVLAWRLVLKSIKVSYLFLYFLPRCPY